MTATRRRPGPNADGLLIHGIGDTHTGQISWPRMDAVARSVVLGDVPTPALTFQLGDNTNDGLVPEMDIFKGFMGRLNDPWYPVMGNHDWGVLDGTSWAESFTNVPARNYTVEHDDIRVICLAGDSGPLPGGSWLSVDTLTYLDTQLGSTAKPCFVACHFPLYDTVGGDAALEYTSTQSGFYAATAANPASSSDILDALASHTTMKAWLSGHTHSRVDAPGFVMPVTAGSQRFAHINTSSPFNTTKSGATIAHPIVTTFINWLGDRIEVVARDHGASRWFTPPGVDVMAVDGLS